ASMVGVGPVIRARRGGLRSRRAALGIARRVPQLGIRNLLGIEGCHEAIKPTRGHGSRRRPASRIVSGKHNPIFGTAAVLESPDSLPVLGKVARCRGPSHLAPFLLTAAGVSPASRPSDRMPTGESSRIPLVYESPELLGALMWLNRAALEAQFPAWRPTDGRRAPFSGSPAVG